MLAKQCTKPKPSSAYQDSEETKDAFAQARRLRTGEAWTRARSLRKKARRLWEQQRLVNATSGNWSAYKDLIQRGNQGWDSCFAEAQGDTNPHEVIHTHLEKLYTTGDVIPPLPAWDGPVENFTLAELRFVLAQGKKGKAVGTDGTSQELLCGIAELPGGAEALLNLFNRVYRAATIPNDWQTALMVVIPKELFPVEAKNLRPLSMSSSVSKCFCRLLMLRTSGALTHTGSSQCSGAGRQTAEYLFCVGRLMQLESEWHAGFAIAKLDLHKAYDMVNRKALLARLRKLWETGLPSGAGMPCCRRQTRCCKHVGTLLDCRWTVALDRALLNPQPCSAGWWNRSWRTRVCGSAGTNDHWCIRDYGFWNFCSWTTGAFGRGMQMS